MTEPFNQYAFKWDNSKNEYVCTSHSFNDLPKDVLTHLKHQTRLKLETLNRVKELEKAFKKAKP